MSRLLFSLMAGGVCFYPLSGILSQAATSGEVAVALLVVSFTVPALAAWSLYPGGQEAVRDSRIDHERIVRYLYFIGGFSVFFGVGARAAYAVGRWFGFGGYLLAWTTVCGTLSGVSLSVWFWRD